MSEYFLPFDRTFERGVVASDTYPCPADTPIITPAAAMTVNSNSTDPNRVFASLRHFKSVTAKAASTQKIKSTTNELKYTVIPISIPSVSIVTSV